MVEGLLAPAATIVAALIPKKGAPGRGGRLLRSGGPAGPPTVKGRWEAAWHLPTHDGVGGSTPLQTIRDRVTLDVDGTGQVAGSGDGPSGRYFIFGRGTGRTVVLCFHFAGNARSDIAGVVQLEKQVDQDVLVGCWMQNFEQAESLIAGTTVWRRRTKPRP